MKQKESIAKVIRVISVPPVMITLLIIILYFGKNEYFRNPQEMFVSIALLGFVPVLAYPLQRFVPGLKDKGREGQRKLAFIANLMGYTAALIWSILAKVEEGLSLVCFTYFISVVILSVCNMFHFKVSGHACSFTGPLILLVYSFGWKMIIPCIIIALIVAWSSIVLKRHTVKQLIGGMAACLVSFTISFLIIKL